MSEEAQATNEAPAAAEPAAPAAGEKPAKDAKGAKPEAAGKPAKAAKAPKAPKAPGKPFVMPPQLLLVGVIVLGLGAGSALGGFLVAPRVNQMRHAAAVASLDPSHNAGKKGKKKDAKDKKGEAGKSPVYKLDNIIVNPAGSQGQRFLMCSVAIESDDPKALDVLREHEIELRDKVVTLLSTQTLDHLMEQGARDSLRTALLKVIRPTLGADAADTELKVYLPNFVVQ